MCVCESPEKLLADGCNHVACDRSGLLDPVLEGHALDVLHDQKDPVVLDVDVVERHDVRVAQGVQDLLLS